MKKYIAEGLGAGVLTFVVGLSVLTPTVFATPVLAALVLGVFVYTIGFLSGCHINPAVTIGAWSIKKISTYDALWYLVAQIVGAMVALYALMQVGTMPDTSSANSITIAVAELVGACLFAFGIASVIYGRTPSAFSGVVVGLSLFLGIMLSVFLGGAGILNPAVALGIGAINTVYALAPIAGAVIGMQLYRYLQS